ncbi:MAG: hypothetical protein M3327_01420 [Actinomycetota bacterium]|nr:hypothetical protein [Actinomycetota bacterium]
MGNVVVWQFLTLDGVFEDRGGAEGFARGGWTFRFDRDGVVNRERGGTLGDDGAAWFSP